MEATKKKPTRIGVVGWLGIGSALLCLGGLFLIRPYLNFRLRGEYVMCRAFASNLAGAIRQYEASFGERPHGDANAILKALRGENQAERIFLDVRASMQDSNGAVLDPWRTPYRIETNQTNGLSIRSAGPNRHFGDVDDLEQSL